MEDKNKILLGKRRDKDISRSSAKSASINVEEKIGCSEDRLPTLARSGNSVDESQPQIGEEGSLQNINQIIVDKGCKADFNATVDLELPFDNKEDFIKEVIWDKTLEREEIIVLGMWYESKEMAENVESILIDALRRQITNSDSEKPLLMKYATYFRKVTSLNLC
uniref:ELM2 domain-containing protein n=1 Tax=Rhabditophanes sp. KR3021 TaxID=114890 RepID=A0AC35TKI8_9BILA